MTGNPLKDLNYAVTKCKKCKEVIDIKNSHVYRNLIVQVQTLREEIKFKDLHLYKIHRGKNGQIQIMHERIKLLVGLMTEEQKEKAKGINQQMREQLKKIENETFKK